MYWDVSEGDSNAKYQVEIVLRSRDVLITQKEGKSHKQFRYSIDWSQARSLSTKYPKARAKLSKGVYQFRVKKEDGSFSQPKQFRVR